MTTVLPEINFLTTDPQAIVDDVIKIYEQLEGRKLAQADPLRLIFLAFASFITKQNVNINDAAKQNLLYYARNDVLDHKGYAWNTPRIGNDHATSIVRMYVSIQMSTAKIIPKGSLITSSEGLVTFETMADLTIQPGEMFGDVDVICTEQGLVGNGFNVGELDTLIVPLPFIDRIENITLSDGGTERESDDAYRERIHQAPEKISTAGSSGAYEYHTRSASAAISDVYVDTPEPGYVTISVLMSNGTLPSTEILDDVYAAVTPKNVRPLTDFVTVQAPTVVNFSVNVTYYIETEAVNKTLIQQAIEKAIDDYIIWQSSKIGRDINPTRLISECYRAGAKRVEVTSPIKHVIRPGEVAQIDTKSVIYGGVEDD